MNNQFQPWAKYPSLQPDRLSIIAGIFRRVRSDAIALHDPANGDGEWCLGCRIYERTCHAMKDAAKIHSWLKILHEAENLRFSFAIGDVPFRFYRGKPNDPPERFLSATFGELHHLQCAFKMEGLRPLDKILRLAVETDPATREVSTVTFVETDEAGNVTETYNIPFNVEQSKVTRLEIKPHELPPITLEPRNSEKENQKKERGKGSDGRKLGS